MDVKYAFKRNIRQWLHIFVYLAVAYALASGVYAQEHLQPETRKHFLWSMQTKKNTIYLLGSVHVLKSDAYPLAPEIERAYEDAQRLVFETNMDEVNDPAVQAKMMTLGLYTEGQTLNKNVSEETYKLLEQKLTAAGIPMASFNRFKPWLSAVTLSVMELQKLGFDPSYGVDAYFFDRAKKDAKEIIPLESAEYQLKLFAQMDDREQESFLRQTLEDLEVAGTMASDMVDAWKSGDVDKLNSIISVSFKEHPDVYDRFVVRRNKNWISKIENLMNQGDNVLVIVGAAHLVGAKSLLDLLKVKGYIIEQR
ncbi:MAG: TraB/GumN family protein [Desulfobacterales bacterium]|nr:MAG: TraB/GumN family protein [Desulfobacterales bacterium]